MATRRIVAQTATGVHGQPIETFELYAILRYDFETYGALTCSPIS
jgi:hypothetical protein